MHRGQGMMSGLPIIASMVRALSGFFGTQTNDNAPAGAIGEQISSTVASGAAVALTSNVQANVTSMTLTAGDWDVTGFVYHNLAGTTTLTISEIGISTTSATLPAATGGTADYSAWRQASAAPGGLFVTEVGPVRLSLAASTTVYLVVRDTFGTSTDAAYGTLRARRVR